MSVRKKKQSIREFLENLPPPTEEEIQMYREAFRSNSREVAIAQIFRALPKGSGSSDANPLFQAAAFLATFLPSDGPESALARLMIATTNAAMDCFARANAGAAEVRDLELNYAVKLSLVAAALGKALDQHRASKNEEY